MPTTPVSKVRQRMRNLHRALLAGSLALTVALVTGCGGSSAGLLTGDQSSGLQNQLNRISSALSAGDCTTVRRATRSLAARVAGLPPSVNVNLRQAIVSEANQVNTLSLRQCHPVSATKPQTTPTTPTAPTTTTPTTAPTTPTTAPTTPTSTTTTPATTPTTSGTNSGGGGLPGGTGGGAGVVGGNGNGNGQ